MAPNKKNTRPPEKSVYTLNLRKARADEPDLHHLEHLEALSSYAVHDRAKQDLERYTTLQSHPNPVSRFFKTFFHVIWWGIRLILPSFLVGHPSLWDNIKTLWKNPNFRPLRMLAVGWLIFALVVGSASAYFFIRATQIHAAGNPSIQTGYYLGTGTTLNINNLGFTPQVLIIKSDTAAGAAILKTSSMPAGEYAYLGVAQADNTENQLTLNSNGFTVQADADVNTVGVRYIYIAYNGSNCASGGEMCVSTYTGNGAASQTITTGFQPDLIWDKRPIAILANFRTSSMPTNYTDFFSATVDDTTGLFGTINSTGFTVGGTNNTNGALYYYVAFKVAAGFLSVGQFTGNGTSQSVTGLGYTPNFVLTKAENAADVAAFNITQTWGDYSSVTTATANLTGAITSLASGSFSVGASVDSNNSTTPYDYFSFGGAPTPTPAGSFTMRVGYYTGNGTAQTITGVGFTPDLVMIKSDNSADYEVWSTSLDNNVSHYFAVATANVANGITGMNSDGFSVGSISAVNSNSITYEYVAYGNATSPQNGAQAQDFIVGAYTGNGISGRIINGLGIAPDFVVTKSSAATAGAFRTSSMAANVASMFTATADDNTGVYFQTLNSDGFTIGSNAGVNTAGAVYTFFAFKQGTNTFSVGTYTGSGAGKNITGLAFQPGLVWVKATTTDAAVQRSSSAGITGTNSQYLLNTADAVNMITGFVPTGFSIGTAAQTNTNNIIYRYAAWNVPGATSTPNTPTNSSPAAASTTVDMNPTLTGSAYSDPNNNTQKDTQWQVDDASDFNTPVWIRDAGAAESSTVVNASNGTFMSTLAGKTELSHNTPYYWRVRYSNGLWSAWSTPTSFTTNVINPPTNSSPTSGATVTTLSPLLLASAFSDQEGTDSSGGAEWQIDTSTAFTSPYYDTGAISYSNSYSVPAALLSNSTTYYWRVRYEDQSGQWSSYSSPTNFQTSQSTLVVNPLFTNTVVNQGDQLNIDAQIGLSNGSVVNDAVATINIFSPSGTELVTNGSLNYVSGSSGIYQYSYSAPTTNGSYLYQITATESGNTGYGSGNFQIKTISSDITALNTALANASTTLGSQLSTANSGITTAQTSINTANTGITTANTGISTANTGITTANTNITADENTLASQISTASSSLGAGESANAASLASLTNNLDVLLGAFIVTQSSVNDPSPTTSSFITSLTNSADGFYDNAVLTFTSGNLKGQSRRVSNYTASTKVITLDPALTSAPANGDTFTIVAQDVNVEQQVSSLTTTANSTASAVAGVASTANTINATANTIASTTSATNATVNNTASAVVTISSTTAATNSTANDIDTKVTNIQATVNSINNTLSSVDSTLDSLQTTVNAVRTSQQSLYTINLTGAAQVQVGTTYQATVDISDYQTQAADASSTPTVVIYDPTRAVAVTSTPMTHTATGEYQYSYSVASDATAGLWETVVTVPVGAGTITRESYWQVTGAPAQVIINDFSNLTVPTISADVTITNEGNGPYEYQYQWCVVSDESDQCGDSDNIANASAAKLIQPGDSFTPNLSLNVSNPGNYWFKLVVTYSGQTSAASRNFTAVSSTSSDSSSSSSSSSASGSGVGTVVVSGLPSTATSPDDVDSTAVMTQLQSNAVALNKVLALLGNVDPNAPGFSSLLQVNEQNTESIQDLQNKVNDLQAVSQTIHDIVSNGSTTPIVQTYMKFDSVVLSFLITNPESSSQTLQFKAYLPQEITPDDIMDADGLTVDYDPTAQSYFVSSAITLAAGQSITKDVEMKDIWVFTADQISALQQKINSYTSVLANTQYQAEGSLLTADAAGAIANIESLQTASYDTPEDHIVVYRSNLALVNQANDDITKLQDLVTEAGASKGLLGNVGGIQTFATWGIILAMVFGFGLMAAIIFSMWRHQMMLTAMAMKMDRRPRV